VGLYDKAVMHVPIETAKDARNEAHRLAADVYGQPPARRPVGTAAATIYLKLGNASARPDLTNSPTAGSSLALGPATFRVRILLSATKSRRA